jgi:preprotein translocase subunit SecG
VIYLLFTLHVLVCVFLILVVLLQQGKGADLSVFGGGSTQTAFGARGATTLLHKITVASFIIFVLTTLAIGILQTGRNASVIGRDTSGKSAVPARAVPGKPGQVAPPAAGKAVPGGAPKAPVSQRPPGSAPAGPGAAGAPAPQAPPASRPPGVPR